MQSFTEPGCAFRVYPAPPAIKYNRKHRQQFQTVNLKRLLNLVVPFGFTPLRLLNTTKQSGNNFKIK